MLKRILVSILIVVLMNTFVYFWVPQLSQEDIYYVSGKCIDVDKGTTHEPTRLLLENGEVYTYSYFEGYSPKSHELKNKHISFCASDKFLLSKKIVAWSENSEIQKETLKEFNENSIRAYTLMAIASLLLGSFPLVPLAFDIAKKSREKAKKRAAKKRKEAENIKKQKQREKFENMDDFTQYRHQQNKNISKKKQKQRKIAYQKQEEKNNSTKSE